MSECREHRGVSLCDQLLGRGFFGKGSKYRELTEEQIKAIREAPIPRATETPKQGYVHKLVPDSSR